ncbi:MAG TPA: adenylosuccinate synthase, partial [Trebonia sp.]
FIEEVKKVNAQGLSVSPESLKIANHAVLILPLHRDLDGWREDAVGVIKIGTTRRGIGPAYEDKVGRRAIRVGDLGEPDMLPAKVATLLAHHNPLRQGLGKPPVDAAQLTRDLLALAPQILPFAEDVWERLDALRAAGKRILFEGAQATMLDIDHGTYPFVTSSNPTAGGACVGAGVGPTRIDKVIGIVKAYTTRVGSGPFPTELNDEWGEYLRKAGGEYGVTTGRARRCGWFDAVIARYATRVNGVTDFFVTKLDVLSTLDKVPVCVAYEVDGQRYDEIPMTQTEFHHAKPVYEYLDGWWEDISQARSFSDLPKAAQDYVKAIEDLSGAPVSAIGVGPRRDQTLQLRPLL